MYKAVKKNNNNNLEWYTNSINIVFRNQIKWNLDSYCTGQSAVHVYEVCVKC